MFENMTTVTQGSIGLGIAIGYFSIKGYTVCVPLIDNQDYDLIVDKNGLQKVQVKTTKYREKSNKAYTVQLKSVRPNKTKNNIKKFDSSNVDLVFVVSEDNAQYLIPAKELDGKASYCLGQKAEQWRVH
jgi:hypothetical protein